MLVAQQTSMEEAGLAVSIKTMVGATHCASIPTCAYIAMVVQIPSGMSGLHM